MGALILFFVAWVPVQDPTVKPAALFGRIDALLYDPTRVGLKRISFEAEVSVTSGTPRKTLRGVCRYRKHGSEKGTLVFPDSELSQAARYAGLTAAILDRGFHPPRWANQWSDGQVVVESRGEFTEVTIRGDPSGLVWFVLNEAGLPVQGDLRFRDHGSGRVWIEYQKVAGAFAPAREVLRFEVPGMGEVGVEHTREYRRSGKYTVPQRLTVTRRWGNQQDSRVTLEVSGVRFDGDVPTSRRL